MLPCVSHERLWDMTRQLCFTPGQSCGYSFTRADVMAMGLGEMVDAIEWLAEQRDAERRAVERASRKR